VRADCRVSITDNSGKKIYMLTDLDNDDLFKLRGRVPIFFATRLPTGDIRPWRLPRDCQANCDISTTPPASTVQDFVLLPQPVRQRRPYANCDSSTTPPI
jgi:hypothetical protein